MGRPSEQTCEVVENQGEFQLIAIDRLNRVGSVLKQIGYDDCDNFSRRISLSILMEYARQDEGIYIRNSRDFTYNLIF